MYVFSKPGYQEAVSQPCSGSADLDFRVRLARVGSGQRSEVQIRVPEVGWVDSGGFSTALSVVSFPFMTLGAPISIPVGLALD